MVSVTRMGDLLDFGQLFKPLAALNWPKSSTFLGNFCKGVKIYQSSSEIILGNFDRHLAIFFWSHCRHMSQRLLDWNMRVSIEVRQSLCHIFFWAVASGTLRVKTRIRIFVASFSLFSFFNILKSFWKKSLVTLNVGLLESYSKMGPKGSMLKTNAWISVTIWPFKTAKICPKVYNICQNRFIILPNTK